MSIYTADDLKADMVRYTDNDTLQENINNLIRYAEGRIWADAKLREMRAKRTYTTTEETRIVDFPDRFGEPIAVRIRSSNGWRDIWFRPESDYAQYVYESTNSGEPAFYFIRGDELEFDSGIGENTEYQILYYYKALYLGDMLDDLTNVPTKYLNGREVISNEILENYPHIYLWACLAEAYSFTENSEFQAIYNGKYVDAMRKQNKQGRQETQAPRPVAMVRRAVI